MRFRDFLRVAVLLFGGAATALAVVSLIGASRTGDTVLLAPACSSFDMFRDYAHRGRAFKEEVGRLQDPRVGRG